MADNDNYDITLTEFLLTSFTLGAI